ncbi:MAG: phospholipase D-like domain-containing protein [Candidatus Woesearchaeota archaeon]|nr:phospholipase D-like domain-containing protein [Candidatus Woesearchaeota archaeon]
MSIFRLIDKLLKNFFTYMVVLAIIISVSKFMDYENNSGNKITGQAIISIVAENNNFTPSVYFCRYDDCAKEFIRLIENSNKTVHCALYDFEYENITDAMVEKLNSGIDVKVVVDNANFKKVKNLNFVRQDNQNQLMHNKFCVFDNKIIFSGSFNPTVKNNIKNDNNMIVYNSNYLAKNYEDEFNEIWKGIFGKGENVKHPIIILNGKKIENYFCSEDHCSSHVITALNNAKKSIYFMQFSFTDNNIGNVLISSKDRLDIKGVMERAQNNTYAEFQRLADSNISVKWDSNKYNMHHKVFIVDNETVITGSYNPTRNADESNDENVLIINDAGVASKYLEEFKRVYGES